MDNKLKGLGADTRPTKKVVHGLVKDITTQACIFDLIDNSIDAIKKGDDSQLLESYKGYEIKLGVNGKRFNISDEGGGISRAKLETSALRFGASDARGVSIGVFGIGLNRALFKLGKEFKISTETNRERISVILNTEQYLTNDDDWHIPIISEALINKTGTLIEITSLTDEAALDFSSSSWEMDFLYQLEKRYEIFLGKGLRIRVNENYINNREIGFREGNFALRHESFEIDGVKIEIKAGQHFLHRFSYEDQDSENNNKKLTQDYGWIVYCNDRAVLFSDTSQQTGCAGFHAQYYGFVGKATFVGDSQRLPWISTKTGVDLNNKPYSRALEKMKLFFETWKTHTTLVKKGTFDANPQMPLIPLAPATITSSANAQNDNLSAPSSGTGASVGAPATSESAVSAPHASTTMHNVPPHPLAHDYLFGRSANCRVDFKIPESEKKLQAVVKEISGLKLKENQFAIALLLRVLVELSLKSFQMRNGNQPQFAANLPLCEKVEKCTDYMRTKNLLSDGHQITTIKSLCDKRGRSTITIEYLQNTIHSNTSMLPSDGLLAFWHGIQPFIRACFSGVR